MRFAGLILTLAVLAAGASVAYYVVRSDALEAAYRIRLEALSQDYARLAERHAAVVRRTAVTELVAEHGKLHVVIATLDGELRRIATPFNPKSEIHVDFVVRDGRLWIRRIHDDATAAKDALVIDPALAGIEWDGAGTDYGLAIYRPLADGRWVISVTANGALGLVKKERSDEPVRLEPTAPVKTFDELDRDARNDARQRLAELDLSDLAAGLWRVLTH